MWFRLIAEFNEITKIAFDLLAFVNSQKQRSLDELDDLLLEFLISWQSVFPCKTCFNKLDFLIQHVNKVTDYYGVYGCFSAESHESVHVRLEKLLAAMKRMSSTRKRFWSFVGQATVDLKDSMVNNKNLCEKDDREKEREIQHHCTNESNG